MTMKEWAHLPSDVRGELVDGHLTEEETPTRAHERVVTWLLVLFSKWLDARGGGEVTRGLVLDLDALWRKVGPVE